jgi:hypothetical protein
MHFEGVHVFYKYVLCIPFGFDVNLLHIQTYRIKANQTADITIQLILFYL